MGNVTISNRSMEVIAKSAGWTVEKVRSIFINRKNASVDDMTTLVAAIENTLAEKGSATEKDRAAIEELEQAMIDMIADATNGKIKLPIGFMPHTLESFLATFIQRVPDIAIDLAKRANAGSTSKEIGPGIETMQRLEAKGLILFAEHRATNAPAFFIAAPKDFDDAIERAAAERIVNYFDQGGDFDARRGEILGADGRWEIRETDLGDRRYAGDILNAELGYPVKVAEWFAMSGDELKRLQSEMKCSRKVLEAMLTSAEERGLLALRRLPDGVSAHILTKEIESLSHRERELFSTIARMFGTVSNGRLTSPDQILNPPSRPGEHTYMRAIEVQYQAAADMAEIVHHAHSKGMMLFDGMPAAGLYAFDVKTLRQADTFCWFDDPKHAVEAAAASLPTSVRMIRDLTSGQSGWWYFVNPLDVVTVDLEGEGKPPMIALLWAWDSRPVDTEFGQREEFGCMFSAYVWGQYQDGRQGPMPTARFFWPENTSLQSMMLMTAREYDDKYQHMKLGEPNPEYMRTRRMTKADTLECVERIARFFAAGCLWVQQKILSYSKSPAQRHWKKRTEKEQKLQRPISDVQIIQLRRRQVVSTAAGEDGHTVRDWKCRWIVTGHWRNQFFPSKGKHEEIWIDSYPKGPDDKPLKVPSHRVYAVSR